MNLYLELALFSNTIVQVCYAIAGLIAITVISKVVIVALATKRQKVKEVKENDNSGNKKRSSKTNVHKSR